MGQHYKNVHGPRSASIRIVVDDEGGTLVTCATATLQVVNKKAGGGPTQFRNRIQFNRFVGSIERASKLEVRVILSEAWDRKYPDVESVAAKKAARTSANPIPKRTHWT